VHNGGVKTDHLHPVHGVTSARRVHAPHPDERGDGFDALNGADPVEHFVVKNRRFGVPAVIRAVVLDADGRGVAHVVHLLFDVRVYADADA
jgi:hypothetical protein